MPPDADARTQFRMAINGRNVPLADIAARRAPLSLDQALEYVLLLAETCDPRLPRASARLVGRLVLERALGPAEHAHVAAILERLAVDPDGVRAELLPLCRR